MKTQITAVLLCLFLVSPVCANNTDTAPVLLSDADIETLVAPIALYPDALVGIILPASVNSTDIVLAARRVTNRFADVEAPPIPVSFNL